MLGHDVQLYAPSEQYHVPLMEAGEGLLASVHLLIQLSWSINTPLEWQQDLTDEMLKDCKSLQTFYRTGCKLCIHVPAATVASAK
jgi:hypothetical protein